MKSYILYIYNTYQIHVFKAYNFVLELQILIKECTTKRGTVRIFEKVSIFLLKLHKAGLYNLIFFQYFWVTESNLNTSLRAKNLHAKILKRFHNPPCSKTKQNKNSQSQR